MQPKDVFVATPQAVQKANKLVREINQPLLHIKSFFPFDLFPNELIINPIEVVFIDNMFFWVSYQTSMPIEGIGDVILTHGPIFATLTIMPTSTLAKDQPIHISWLTRPQAQKAHDLLEGLVRLKKENIDIETIIQNKGFEEIAKLGSARG